MFHSFLQKSVARASQTLKRFATLFLVATTLLWNVSAPIGLLTAQPAFAASVVTVTNGSFNANAPGAFISASSPANAILKVSVTASSASKELSSVQVNFSGTGFATSDLATLATGSSSGVALYDDAGGTVGTFDGTDSVISLTSGPAFSGNNIILTPNVAPSLGSGGSPVIFYVVIKTSASAVSGHHIAATIPINGVVTTDGSGPTSSFSNNDVVVNTSVVAPTIVSASSAVGSSSITVKFSASVQEIGASGVALATSDFTFVDAGGAGTSSISGVTHTAGQDFATITVSPALDSADVGPTGATIAAGSNKIVNMAGNVMGTSAIRVLNPLNFSTATIPNATALAVYGSGTELVTLGASGGTSPYTFAANAAGDTSILSSLGLSLASDGKVTGTVANTPGSFSVNLKVTDSAGSPVTVSKMFTINVAPSTGGGVPGINGIGPSGGSPSTTITLGIGGVNTHFSSSSVIAFITSATGIIDPSFTPTITTSSATGVSASVVIGSGAVIGAHDVRVTTGTEVALMPNGFTVVAAGASGLNLLLPTDAATNVQMPPGFNFNPSTESTVNTYRVTLKSTSNFSGSALWDYVFPKPSNPSNTNGSHCSATSCNVGYGSGTFRVMTQPASLAPNTTYYWQIRTYVESFSAVSDANTPVELTSVRSFTTVSSVTDVVPPQIIHRPIMQLQTGGDRTIFARVTDNIATATSTPGLTTTLYYCNTSSSCIPGATVEGTSVGSGYYSYVFPSGDISGTMRYYLSASDGTNTTRFKQPDGITPFTITTVASPVTTHKLVGTVTDSTGACLAGATVFADGTTFNTTSASCAGGSYSLSSIPPGSYDIVAFKTGFGERRMQGMSAVVAADSTTSYPISLTSGATGGFGGDTTAPRIKFTGPSDGMRNIPGGDSNTKIFVVFNKDMSQSTISALNMKVNNATTGSLVDVTSNGTWTYYPTAPGTPGFPNESKMAVWVLNGSNTLGDNRTIAVTLSNLTDTAGNTLQGNQPDGSYAFTFTTGSTATFTGGVLQGGTVGSGAFVPPFVSGVTPAPGTVNVPINSKIVLNFSDIMADDAGSYVLKNSVKLFTVSGTTETDVSSGISTVTLDNSKKNAIVTLTSSLTASTKYRVKVLGSAKASNGNTMAPLAQATTVMYKADFTSGSSSSSDTAAPTIKGSFPDNGATSIPVNMGSIGVAFSKDMDSSTLTTNSFYLSIGSTPVNGTVEYKGLERTAMFVPKAALSPSTTYTINLTADIKGLNGTAITAATRSFTTGAADTVAPGVAFVNGDDFNLAVTFSEPMINAKVTDSINYPASVLKPGNIALKFGVAGFSSGAGTTIAIPTSATFSYDAATSTLSIQGYHDGAITAATLIGKEILITVTNVKDMSGNTIGASNTGRADLKDSSVTKGAIAPGSSSSDAGSRQGAFRPDNFSSSTFGFAPPVNVMPMNSMVGVITAYKLHIPISKQIPAGGSVVVTFPSGFDVSGAKQDVNSPNKKDFNGPGTGTPTFKCTTATGGTSCGGSATITGDTSAGGDSTTRGGLADDGVVVNTDLRTVTMALSAVTNSEGHDFLTIDIAGIKNTTVPKDFNTSGYTTDVKTKSADGLTMLESLTSMPFFIQAITGTAGSLTGTITAAGASSGTMKVYLMSPMTGFVDTTSGTFNAGSGTYTFSNLQAGEYMLSTDQGITLGATDYIGKSMPERVVVSGSTTYNFTIAVASSGTAVTINVDGPSAEPIDIFANSPTNGFKVKSVTLDSSAGAQAITLNLPDGNWNVGVGPQMPKGMSGPPPSPSYLPPKPKNIIVTNPTCKVDGTSGCSTTFTLTTSTKSIKGLVQDGSGKVIAGAQVYAYSPSDRTGTNTTADSAGAFTLGITDGTYMIGAFIPGMPSSKQVPVTVTNNATTYLLIDGASTAITPAAAASSFILKLSKPDYTISGKVTDGTNTIQGASVYAYRTDGPGNGNAITDSSGNYTLYVPAGTWKVASFVPKYGNLAEQTVTITTASASNIDFAPSTTGTYFAVSGTITSNSSVVQGAFVHISGNGIFNEAITGVDGKYSFNVPSTASLLYTVRATIPNVGESAPTAAFAVTADVTGKDITVGTLNTITLTFSSSVTEAFVDLFSSTGVGSHVKISSATSGTLSLPDGSYTVHVGMPGVNLGLTDVAATSGSTVYSNTTGVVVVNGAEGLTVTLPTLRTITGTVKDGADVNVADAWVELGNATTGVHFGTKTATDGTFSLKAADGTYQLNAMKPGFFRTPSSFVVNGSTGAQTLTLTAATTTIGGTIKIGSSGAANAFVRAEKQGGGFAGTQADANGIYSLPVTSGIWKVFAVADGYTETAFASNPIDVTAGSVTGKDITLTTTVTVSAPRSQSITPASGGTLDDTTSGTRVTLPASALGSSTSAGNVTATETSNVRETSTAKLVKSDVGSGTYVAVGKDIKATDSSGNPITTLGSDAIIEQTFTVLELANTASATDSSINTKAEVDAVKLAYWDETTQSWVTLPTTITYKDSSGSVLTDSSALANLTGVATVTFAASTSHFSLYAPVTSPPSEALATPSGLTVTGTSATSIGLAWTVVSGATGYDLYRSTTSGGTFTRVGSEPTVSSGSTLTYSDTGLTAGTYYYKITTLNSAGESAASSAVSGVAGSTSSGGGGGGSSAPMTLPSTTTTTTTTTQTTPTTTPAVKAVPATPAVSAKVVRDLKKEKDATTVFIKKYHHLPKTSADWKWVNDMAYPVVKVAPVKATPAKPATQAKPATPAKPVIKPTAKAEVPKPTSAPVTTTGYPRTLNVGTKGDDVSRLQTYLGVKKTGTFDAATKKAVQAYQKAHDIKPANGNVGPATRAALSSNGP